MTLRNRSYVVPAQVKAAAKQKNFRGPNGNEAIAYQWIWKWDLVFSKAEDGMVDAKVSDWDNAATCSTCNRKIVHVYWVRKQDGKIVPAGGDHLHQLLGYPKELGQGQLRAIQRQVTDLDIKRKEEAGIRKRYEQIIAQREADSLGEANKKLMLWSRKAGISLPPIGSESPGKMWLVNMKKKKVMRTAGLAVDRFLSMYPDWERTSNIGDVLKLWGER